MLLFSASCFPQLAFTPLNIGSFNSGAYRSHIDDPLSCISNPATFANISALSAAIYTEKKFLLRELNQATGLAAIPVGSAVIGTVMSYGGYDEYNESQLGLAYSRKLGRVCIGIEFNYQSVHIAGYGSDAAIGAVLGTIWHLSDHLNFGIHITNPGGRLQKDHEEKLASSYSMGAGYEPSSQLLIAAEIIKEENKPATVHVGLQYQVMDHLQARVGVMTDTSMPYLGLGWKWKNIGVSVMSSYHPQLGITPGLEIIFLRTDQEKPNPSS